MKLHVIMILIIISSFLKIESITRNKTNDVHFIFKVDVTKYKCNARSMSKLKFADVCVFDVPNSNMLTATRSGLRPYIGVSRK